MTFYKFRWAIRRIIYACFFPKISFYGYLGKPVTFLNKSRICLKNKSRIFPGSRLEVHSVDGLIEVGENVSIGQNFHCTAIGNLKIGKNTLITPNVCITDIDHDYEPVDIIMEKQSYIYRKTEVGENCFIGFGSVIQAGTLLGSNCIVGANSVLRGEYPSNSVIVGAPGKVIKQFDNETQSWKKIN